MLLHGVVPHGLSCVTEFRQAVLQGFFPIISINSSIAVFFHAAATAIEFTLASLLIVGFTGNSTLFLYLYSAMVLGWAMTLLALGIAQLTGILPNGQDLPHIIIATHFAFDLFTAATYAYFAWVAMKLQDFVRDVQRNLDEELQLFVENLNERQRSAIKQRLEIVNEKSYRRSEIFVRVSATQILISQGRTPRAPDSTSDEEVASSPIDMSDAGGISSDSYLEDSLHTCFAKISSMKVNDRRNALAEMLTKKRKQRTLLSIPPSGRESSDASEKSATLEEVPAVDSSHKHPDTETSLQIHAKHKQDGASSEELTSALGGAVAPTSRAEPSQEADRPTESEAIKATKPTRGACTCVSRAAASRGLPGTTLPENVAPTPGQLSPDQPMKSERLPEDIVTDQSEMTRTDANEKYEEPEARSPVVNARPSFAEAEETKEDPRRTEVKRNISPIPPDETSRESVHMHDARMQEMPSREGAAAEMAPSTQDLIIQSSEELRKLRQFAIRTWPWRDTLSARIESLAAVDRATGAKFTDLSVPAGTSSTAGAPKRRETSRKRASAAALAEVRKRKARMSRPLPPRRSLAFARRVRYASSPSSSAPVSTSTSRASSSSLSSSPATSSTKKQPSRGRRSST